MSTLTTARGALLRRAGTLLVAAALVGAPATSAFADPTATPAVSPSAEASPTASSSASPSPSATATATGEPTPTTSPSATTSPSPSDPAPSPSASGSPTAPAATPSAPATTFLKGASASVLAQAASAATPQTAYAADFIARTLASGDDHYNFPEFPGFPISPDVGNTIDAILALDGAGAGSNQANASFAFVEANVSNYMGADFASTFAGPTAKALLAVLAQGGDPTAFGGVDLLGSLQATEGAVEPGRFSDLPVDCGFGQCDFSNTIGQSLAIIALIRAGEPVSTASVDFLLAQQCADGGFRNDMDAQVCTSDADATAFA